MKKTINRVAVSVMAMIMAITAVVAGEMITNGKADAGTKKPRVQEIEYDREDREVTIEFYGRVKYKRAKVKIYDGKGRNYVRYIKEKDSDDMEVKVKKLKYGKKYKYKISGIKRRGARKYVTIKGTFRAVDR